MRSSKPAEMKKAFRVISRRRAFKGHAIRLDVLQIQTRSGHRVERELIQHNGAVVIIPKLPGRKLLLVKQLRVAVGKEIWEFPAGTLERGESPLECAKRELQEETLWKAMKWRKILTFFPTPGISTEKMFLFEAENLQRSHAHQPDWDEEIEVRIFSYPQIKRMIRRGAIIDGKTILGFLLIQEKR